MHESITTISPVVSSSHAFQRWKQKQSGTSTHQSSDASAATNEQAPGWACVDSNAQAQRGGRRWLEHMGERRESMGRAVARILVVYREALAADGGRRGAAAANEKWQSPLAATEVKACAVAVARHSQMTLVVRARTSSESWLLRAMTSHVGVSSMERRQRQTLGGARQDRGGEAQDCGQAPPPLSPTGHRLCRASPIFPGLCPSSPPIAFTSLLPCQ
uniref:Uncharacterized protein n=1 Tax=Oryza barthii TaxID=65489 RepID=A0A0D3GI19_9ORYZ